MPSKGELLGYVWILSCTSAQWPRPLCFASLSSYHVFYHFLAAAPPLASSLAHLQTYSNSLPLTSLPAPESLAPLTPSGASSPAPFILLKASTPIPGKLAGTALHRYEGASSRQYCPLMERLEEFPPNVGQAPHQQAAQREMVSIRSWVCAFTTYIAILSEARPE